MRRSIFAAFAALLFACACGSAHAEGPGRYAVEGANPNGQGQYRGTAVLTQTGHGTWHMAWTIGTESFEGFGIGDSKLIAVTFSSGRTDGIAMYAAQADGSYHGIWSTREATATGIETLTPR